MNQERNPWHLPYVSVCIKIQSIKSFCFEGRNRYCEKVRLGKQLSNKSLVLKEEIAVKIPLGWWNSYKQLCWRAVANPARVSQRRLILSETAGTVQCFSTVLNYGAALDNCSNSLTLAPYLILLLFSPLSSRCGPCPSWLRPRAAWENHTTSILSY